MCLNKIKDGLQIATEDIVVYKWLVYSYFVDFNKLYHGANCKVKKSGTNELVEGKISLVDNSYYVCTDSKELDGSVAEELFGYEYSWYIDSEIAELYIDDINVTQTKFATPFRRADVKLEEVYYSDLEYVSGKRIVEKGLHSFVNMDSDPLGEVLVECIIPKGSEYYLGMFDGEESIASNCLKYVKIIKECPEY